MLPKPIENLISAFQLLPGIGRKSAERFAFFLLNAPQEKVDELTLAISEVKNALTICKECGNIADSKFCKICDDKSRDRSTICVVENPLDVIALEKSGTYKGLYHILGGALSPTDGIGPDHLRIQELYLRVKPPVQEIILATNPSLEGEATAMYLQKELKAQGTKCKISRIARGLPVGASIEYADEITLRQAMEGRREY